MLTALLMSFWVTQLTRACARVWFVQNESLPRSNWSKSVLGLFHLHSNWLGTCLVCLTDIDLAVMEVMHSTRTRQAAAVTIVLLGWGIPEPRWSGVVWRGCSICWMKLVLEGCCAVVAVWSTRAPFYVLAGCAWRGIYLHCVNFSKTSNHCFKGIWSTGLIAWEVCLVS